MYGPEYEKIIFEICKKLGIMCNRIDPNCLALTWQGKTQYIWSRRFPQNSATCARIIDSKCVCSSVLISAGIPAVRHHKLYRSDMEQYTQQEYSSQRLCETLLSDFGGIVVKPNDSCEGKGVYVCFTSKEIEIALHKLFQEKSILAVSPYINACAEYRIIYLRGECLLIYKKKLPEVVGDGYSSIGLLAEHMGIRKVDLFTADRLTDIPAKGEHVTVGWKFNLSCGSKPEVLGRTSAPPKIYSIAFSAAKVLNANFVSIDVIEEEKTHALMVLELNAGVAMDQFILKAPNGRDTALYVYERGIRDMFNYV